ncbi:MAG: PEP-utilizing enzyme [Candidatus Micrarchaeota archaeon]
MKKLLTGICASSGKAEGVARVVANDSNLEAFQEGEILVTKITDPTMTIVMNRASAIVCDIGGIGSHPAIIARELGIPCVVATRNATQIIKTGDKILVNASEGVVYGMD